MTISADLQDGLFATIVSRIRAKTLSPFRNVSSVDYVRLLFLYWPIASLIFHEFFLFRTPLVIVSAGIVFLSV